MPSFEPNASDTAVDLNQFPPFLAKRVQQFYAERVNEAWGGQHILNDRPKPEPGDIQLMSNDYLAIANHPTIVQAQARALLEQDNNVFMSALFLQAQSLQRTFEQEMADFLRAPRTVLCQSGWCANVGLVQSIASPTVPVYVDLLAHMSLWEGVRSAGARAIPVRHNDVGHLKKQIKRYGPGIVMVDSVYSTNGSVAPLTDTVHLAHQQDCIIVVDESHSLGTHGPQGRGLVVAQELADKVHFRTASLAKAFVGRAGIITCSEQFFDYFISTSKPAIFSSVLLPHDIVGLYQTLQLIQAADDRRAQLHHNAAILRHELDQLGYDVAAGQSQIVAIEPGFEQRAIQLHDALAAQGVFGAIFCAPATAKNRSLIRLSVHAGLTTADNVRIVAAFKAIRQQAEVSAWLATGKRKHQASL